MGDVELVSKQRLENWLRKAELTMWFKHLLHHLPSQQDSVIPHYRPKNFHVITHNAISTSPTEIFLDTIEPKGFTGRQPACSPIRGPVRTVWFLGIRRYSFSGRNKTINDIGLAKCAAGHAKGIKDMSGHVLWELLSGYTLNLICGS